MPQPPSPQDPDALRVFGDSVSFGRTAGDYATHRAGFPQAFFDLITARFYASAPARALDIGTGTGTLARGLARLGLQTTALDPSDDLMAQAARLDAETGVTTTYIKGTAESLPFDDAAFDLVTAGQCWHWFDRPRAAAEAARVPAPRRPLPDRPFRLAPPARQRRRRDRGADPRPQPGLGPGRTAPASTRHGCRTLPSRASRRSKPSPSTSPSPIPTPHGAAASGPAPVSRPACPKGRWQSSIRRLPVCWPGSFPKSRCRSRTGSGSSRA